MIKSRLQTCVNVCKKHPKPVENLLIMLITTLISGFSTVFSVENLVDNVNNFLAKFPLGLHNIFKKRLQFNQKTLKKFLLAIEKNFSLYYNIIVIKII